MTLKVLTNEGIVTLTNQQENARLAEWAANIAAGPAKRPLPRWAFMQVINEWGLFAVISGAIAAMPEGLEKRRAQGKWDHAVSFEPTASEMVTLANEVFPNPSDFNAIWAAGEALAYDD